MRDKYYTHIDTVDKFDCYVEVGDVLQWYWHGKERIIVEVKSFNKGVREFEAIAIANGNELPNGAIYTPTKDSLSGNHWKILHPSVASAIQMNITKEQKDTSTCVCISGQSPFCHADKHWYESEN